MGAQLTTRKMMLCLVLTFCLVASSSVCLGLQPSPIQLQNLHKPWFWIPTTPSMSATLLGFSWSSCGSSSDLAKVNNLSVLPDPIDLPGNVTAKGDGSLSKDVGSPLKAVLKLYKKAIVWIEIPCVDNLGSCTYDDVCALLENITIPDCPLASCKCPFPAGTYDLGQGVTVNIPVPTSIPSWAGNGDYKVDITLTDSTGEQVACLEIIVTLKFNKDTPEFNLETTTKQTRFTRAFNHPDAVSSVESCEPQTFSYKVCALNSPHNATSCPAGQFCKHLICPFPGQCYLPSNCSCDASGTLQCTNDPTHKTECNSDQCGVCEAKLNPRFSKQYHKAFSFRGSTLVPVTLHYENTPWNIKTVEDGLMLDMDAR